MTLPPRIIVYDGVCHLCNRWLSFLPPRDVQCRYHYCPMQTATGAALMRQHGLDPQDPISFLYVEDGRAYLGTRAILRILTGLGGAWRWLAVLNLVPGPLREWGYGIVARNRYRWFGRTPTCVIPSPDLRQRFVEWPGRT